ncbi:MAG: helix-turn-helix domain-containing protein [Acidobacteriota bacterium]|nr:helix-turn-helix domain-containing protein [Acidobacteriota bacterium]
MTRYRRAGIESKDPNHDEAICPLCEEPATTSVVEHTFTHGETDLTVMLPVRRCADCELEFVDSVGERIRREAVCHHFGILSPWEIRAIREQRELSRSQFADITALGEATIKRWESGIISQNRANDRYLRLLANDLCWSALERLAAPKPEPRPGRVLAGPWRQLSDVSQELRHAQETFSPRRSHVA